MKSVLSFNKEQRETFNLIVSDLSGPTMTAFVLAALESVLDESNSGFESDEVTDIDVCMAALEYFRMQSLGSGD